MPARARDVTNDSMRAAAATARSSVPGVGDEAWLGTHVA